MNYVTTAKLGQAFKSKEVVLFFIFIALFALMCVISPGLFLTRGNLQSMAEQLPELGIFAIAMMIVIVSGGINLSLTFNAALASIVGGLVLARMSAAGSPTVLVMAAGIATFLVVAMLCGALNAFVVATVGISPILATLGTMILFEGICLNITKGGAVSGFPDAFLWIGSARVLGLPFPMILFLLVALASYFLLERSAFGLRTYMIGCNPTATAYSGVNVPKILYGVYLFSGLLAGLAGILMASRYNSAKESYGSSYLLQSISAAVLGGTDIVGGHGKIIGTVIAVLILQTISSGLNIFGINRYLIGVIMGGILILVLAIHFLNRKDKVAA